MDPLHRQLRDSRHTVHDFTPPADGFDAIERQIQSPPSPPVSPAGWWGPTAKILLAVTAIISLTVLVWDLVPNNDGVALETADPVGRAPWDSLSATDELMTANEFITTASSADVRRSQAPDARRTRVVNADLVGRTPLNSLATTDGLATGHGSADVRRSQAPYARRTGLAEPPPPPPAPATQPARNESVPALPTSMIPPLVDTTQFPAPSPVLQAAKWYRAPAPSGFALTASHGRVLNPNQPALIEEFIRSSTGSTVFLTENERISARPRSTGSSFEQYVRGHTSRLGLSYQFRNGLLLRLGASYRRNETDFYGLRTTEGELPPGFVGVTPELDEHLGLAEFGIQYTFRKRHRLQPYIGLNLVNVVFMQGTSTKVFRDLNTGTKGLVNIFDTQQSGTDILSWNVQAGVQYRFAKRWSAGLYGEFHNNVEIEQTAPLGIEVRYLFR